MSEIEISPILETLGKLRPIFHNEADFQFCLAWEIQKQFPTSEIRLEYKVPGFIGRYTDIWIRGEKPLAVELKYKPISVTLENKDEVFELKNHGAQDLGRYDFLKDLQRVEEIVSKFPQTTGYAIMLTNDPSYWKKPQKQNSVDADFKIDEGRSMHGTLSWSPKASKGTTRGREKPLKIRGKYKIKWMPYFTENQKLGDFRLLCLKVTQANLAVD